ncbi:MAG TPA: hypothetical protein VGH28_23500 [Polyangiaceae bacterium]
MDRRLPRELASAHLAVELAHERFKVARRDASHFERADRLGDPLVEAPAVVTHGHEAMLETRRGPALEILGERFGRFVVDHAALAPTGGDHRGHALGRLAVGRIHEVRHRDPLARLVGLRDDREPVTPHRVEPRGSGCLTTHGAPRVVLLCYPSNRLFRFGHAAGRWYVAAAKSFQRFARFAFGVIPTASDSRLISIRTTFGPLSP